MKEQKVEKPLRDRSGLELVLIGQLDAIVVALGGFLHL